MRSKLRGRQNDANGMGAAGIRDPRNQLRLRHLNDSDGGVGAEHKHRAKEGSMQPERNQQRAKRVVRAFGWGFHFHGDLIVAGDDGIGSIVAQIAPGMEKNVTIGRPPPLRYQRYVRRQSWASYGAAQNAKNGILKARKKPLTLSCVRYLSLRFLSKALKLAEVAVLSALAVTLSLSSGFAFRCGVDEHQMRRLTTYAQQRREACFELGLQWEADDQERQYKAGTSAGTNATVGPIAGFVMDVTENEFGHAEGRCHAVNASYKELLAEYEY
ncbi:MAG TPA: hypothetical protein VGI45_17195 [Terracidiphilus sp.]|jgi:hypothetical protein